MMMEMEMEAAGKELLVAVAPPSCSYCSLPLPHLYRMLPSSHRPFAFILPCLIPPVPCCPPAMSDVDPSAVPEHCPGPESETAGKGSACVGCPNQNICASSKPRGPDPDLPLIEERMKTIRHKILVLSGKGGVGKSTFTANLARAFALNDEQQVGVLDVDICGPSQPKIFQAETEQVHNSGSGWSPVGVDDNVCLMSVGFLLSDPREAVIWRGPKKNGLIKQFLRDVDWGALDYLVVDTPPGTSDEHLSLAQYLKSSHVDGCVIVTTPQEVALSDVRKEISFCKKVGLPIIGVVENMSGFVCPNCKNESAIFPATTGGAERMASEMDVTYLGSIPIDPRLAQSCDQGESFFEMAPDSPAVLAYRNIVQKIQQVVDTPDDAGPSE
eukprot:m.11646 g.11646  ORF g.11646 m.11646 type:complete len:384 (+) comp6608_c0_seq1:1-1152(+)